MVKLRVDDALKRLAREGSDFVRFIDEDAFDVSLYKPDGIDTQTPHLRDEIYVVAGGSGEFASGGKTEPVASGDVLFVRAGAAHRFLNFTRDFSAWVVFIGTKKR